MTRSCFWSVSALAFLLGSVPATAAVITKTYNFVATDFSVFGGIDPPPPIASVTGHFKLAFDDAGLVADSTTGLSAAAISIPLNSAIGYSYAGGGIFILGGLESGVSSIIGATNDFFLVVSSFNTVAPHFENLVYENLREPNSFYISTTGSISVAGVAEPDAWIMLIAGFAVSGAGIRSRRASIATT